MAYYRSVGDIPPTRHTAHRDPEGRLRFEELMGDLVAVHYNVRGLHDGAQKTFADVGAGADGLSKH